MQLGCAVWPWLRRARKLGSVPGMKGFLYGRRVLDERRYARTRKLRDGGSVQRTRSGFFRSGRFRHSPVGQSHSSRLRERAIQRYGRNAIDFASLSLVNEVFYDVDFIESLNSK